MKGILFSTRVNNKKLLEVSVFAASKSVESKCQPLVVFCRNWTSNKDWIKWITCGCWPFSKVMHGYGYQSVHHKEAKTLIPFNWPTWQGYISATNAEDASRVFRFIQLEICSLYLECFLKPLLHDAIQFNSIDNGKY